jgi:hypothetical protein
VDEATLAMGAIDLGATKELPDATKKLFERAMRAGDPDKTRDLLRQVVAQAPKFTVGWLLLGTFAWVYNDYAGAKTDLQRALELDPSSLLAHRMLANLALDIGDTALAKKHADADLQPGPHRLQRPQVAPRPLRGEDRALRRALGREQGMERQDREPARGGVRPLRKAVP